MPKDVPPCPPKPAFPPDQFIKAIELGYVKKRQARMEELGVVSPAAAEQFIAADLRLFERLTGCRHRLQVRNELGQVREIGVASGPSHVGRNGKRSTARSEYHPTLCAAFTPGNGFLGTSR